MKSESTVLPPEEVPGGRDPERGLPVGGGMPNVLEEGRFDARRSISIRSCVEDMLCCNEDY